MRAKGQTNSVEESIFKKVADAKMAGIRKYEEGRNVTI